MAITLATRRTRAAKHRLEAAYPRADTRDWAVNRRERTRQLIELGGFVANASLVDLTGDDRAALYGDARGRRHPERRRGS